MRIINNIFGRILIPLSYYLRLDFRHYYFLKYKRNLKKTRREIEDYQLERLKKLVKHAYETTIYYKELFQKINLNPEDIKTLNDFKKIPPIDKKIVLTNFNKLKSSKKYKTVEISSGGSTGNRITILKDKRYHEISRAIVLRDLYSAGISPGDKIAWFWGSPLENKPLAENILHRVLWSMNRRIIFNTLSYTDKDLKEWLEGEFTKFKPDFIYGYANSIYEAAKFIKQNKISIPPIKKIVCSAQKLEQREFIESAFKCKVLDHYGSREVESIAIENDEYIMHSSDDFVIVEVSDNNEIILTPLESYAMPLLRYKNGDIGIINEKEKNSDSPFKEFNIKIGRSCEILRDIKGNKIYSGKINLQIAKLKLNIGEFQLVQESYEKVILNIVKDNSLVKEDVEKFVQIIKNVLGCKKIEVIYLEKYPVEKSGKKIGYKCLIKDE